MVTATATPTTTERLAGTPLGDLMAEYSTARDIWDAVRQPSVRIDHPRGGHSMRSVDTPESEAARIAMTQTWGFGICQPGIAEMNAQAISQTRQRPRCFPSIVTRDMRVDWPEPDENGRRGWDGDLEYRGVCFGCGWVSDTIRTRENCGVEDAHDHTHPGWRLLPVLDPRPGSDGAKATPKQIAWDQAAGDCYPPDWFEHGGPVITHRSQKYAGRHVPGRAPGGGYDMASVSPPERAGQQALF